MNLEHQFMEKWPPLAVRRLSGMSRTASSALCREYPTREREATILSEVIGHLKQAISTASSARLPQVSARQPTFRLDMPISIRGLLNHFFVLI